MASTPETVDVGAVLDGARFRGLPLRVFGFTAAALVFDGFDIQAIAFAAPALLPAWGITRAELAPVLAAGLLGMGIGSLALGSLGDRWGRRRALIACMVLVALTSFACATADDPLELGVWRLLTGLGLGGAIPNASALMAEFAPARLRNLVVAAAVVGIPVGGLIGAEASARLVPVAGWQSVFVVGGVLPGLLAVAMVLWLPESPRHLARRLADEPHRRVELARLLARIDGGAYDGARAFVPGDAAPAAGGGLRDLWSSAYRRDTGALWLVFATNVFAVYAFFSWLPTVLSSVGLPLAEAIRGAFWFNLGGIAGALFAGWAMSRTGSRPVLLVAVATGVGTTALLGTLDVGPATEPVLLHVLTALAGACIQGVQVGMFPVAAHVYQTSIRAGGIGWALGVARFGGVLSAFAGSTLLAIGASTGSGTAWFFLGISGVLVATFVGVALVRRHVPARR